MKKNEFIDVSKWKDDDFPCPLQVAHKKVQSSDEFNEYYNTKCIRCPGNKEIKRKDAKHLTEDLAMAKELLPFLEEVSNMTDEEKEKLKEAKKIHDESIEQMKSIKDKLELLFVKALAKKVREAIEKETGEDPGNPKIIRMKGPDNPQDN